MRRCLHLLLFLAPTLALGQPPASTAPAESPTSVGATLEDARRSLVAEGERLRRAGAFEAAIEKFEHAHQMAPTDTIARGHLESIRREAGHTAYEARDLETALRHWRAAQQMNRRDVELLNLIGEVELLLGDRDGSRRSFSLALKIRPDSEQSRLGFVAATTHSSYGEQQLSDALMMASALARSSSKAAIRRSAWIQIARLETIRQRKDEARFAWEQVRRMGSFDTGIIIEVGDSYRDLGEPAEALRWYQRCTGPVCQERRDELRWRIEAEKYQLGRATSKLDGTLGRELDQLERSVAEVSAGQRRVVRKRLENLKRRYPAVPRIRALLGDVLMQTGERAKAEGEYLQVIALGAGTVNNYLRLASLYESESGPTRGNALPLASHYLGLAYRSQRRNSALALRYAKTLRAVGQGVKAEQVARASIKYCTSEAECLPLNQFVTTLNRTSGVGPTPDSMALSAAPDYVRALGLHGNGQFNEALAAISSVPPSPAQQLLKGRILYDLGKFDAALAQFKLAARGDPQAHDHHYWLAFAESQLGRYDQAMSAFERARKLGSKGAAIELLERQTKQEGGFMGDLVRSLHLWRDYRESKRLAISPGYSVFGPRIGAIESDLKERLSRIALAISGVCGGLLFAGFLLYRRRRAGLSLVEFLAQHPDASAEVQRILSALRHEILKHNTTALTGLVDAIERGEPHRERAAWCDESLFGGNQGDELCAWERLGDYLEQLEAEARSRETRLNLQYRDHVFGPLLRGFGELKTSLPEITEADTVKPAALRRLRWASELINQRAYMGIVRLLDNLQLTVISAELILEVFDSVCREPAFRSWEIVPPQIEFEAGSQSLKVAVPRSDLEDVLRNPMRNAIQASENFSADGKPIHLGVAVSLTFEPITGLQLVGVEIRDRSPKKLDPDIFHTQGVERGLGLVNRLVTKYEGTVNVVTAAAPWTKGVRVEFPALESESAWNL